MRTINIILLIILIVLIIYYFNTKFYKNNIENFISTNYH